MVFEQLGQTITPLFKDIPAQAGFLPRGAGSEIVLPLRANSGELLLVALHEGVHVLDARAGLPPRAQATPLQNLRAEVRATAAEVEFANLNDLPIQGGNRSVAEIVADLDKPDVTGGRRLTPSEFKTVVREVWAEFPTLRLGLPGER
jgi:hypothetical protein